MEKSVERYIKFLESHNEDVRKAYEESEKRIIEMIGEINALMMFSEFPKLLRSVTPLTSKTTIHVDDKNMSAIEIVNLLSKSQKEFQSSFNEITNKYQDLTK